jgi:PAS domain S-box-containing protein
MSGNPKELLPGELPSTAFERLAEVAAEAAVRPVVLAMAGLYGLFTVAHLLMLPPASARILAPLSFVSALGLLWVFRRARAGLVPVDSHRVLVGVALLVLANSVTHLAVTAEPVQTTNIALVVLGGGVLLFRPRHLVVLLGLAATGWFAAAALDGFADPLWPHSAFALVAACILSTVIQIARNRFLQRVAALEDESRRQGVRLAAEEARYKHLFDASPAMIWSHDLSGGVLAVNRACSEATGVPAESLVGRNMMDFLLNGGDALQEYVAELREKGTASGVAYVVGGDGRTLHWMYQGTLVHDSLGDTHVLTTARDVTELEQAKAELQQAKDDLEGQVVQRTTELRDAAQRLREELREREAMEARLLEQHKLEGLGRLAGGVAHEFNNILAVVGGNAELAAEEIPPDSPAQEYMRDIGAATQRGAGLVAKILEFSHSSNQDHLPYEIEPVLRETVALLRGAMPSDINLEVVVAESLGRVRGGPAQLRQILVNLVANSRQALDGRGGHIRVSAAREPRSDLVRVDVVDDGTGIAETDLPRIFDPFFSTRDVGEGHGLGLSVVHGIVRGHGGTIDVVCPPEGGTRVTFTLPLAVPRGAPACSAGPALAPSDILVLVAEDEPAVLMFACRALERRGYSVIGVREGLEAMGILESRSEDVTLLLTDMSMPGMKGDDLVRRARALRAGLPALVMTGFSAGVDVDVLRKGGATGVLAKPFRTQELFEAVDGLLPVGIPS